MSGHQSVHLGAHRLADSPAAHTQSLHPDDDDDRWKCYLFCRRATDHCALENRGPESVLGRPTDLVPAKPGRSAAHRASHQPSSSMQSVTDTLFLDRDISMGVVSTPDVIGSATVRKNVSAVCSQEPELLLFRQHQQGYG